MAIRRFTAFWSGDIHSSHVPYTGTAPTRLVAPTDNLPFLCQMAMRCEPASGVASYLGINESIPGGSGNFSPTISAGYCQVMMRFPVLPASDTIFFVGRDATGDAIQIGVTSTGVIYALNAAGIEVARSTVTWLADPAKWCRIEVKVATAATGTLAIWINGSSCEDLTFSGGSSPFRATGFTLYRIGKVGTEATTPKIDLAWVVVDDSTYIGNVFIGRCIPTGAGNYTDAFTLTTTGYEDIDEMFIATSTDSVITNNTAGNQRSWTISDIAAIVGANRIASIKAVCCRTYDIRNGAADGSYKGLMRQGGVDALSGAKTAGATAGMCVHLRTTAPDASAWTVAKVQTLEVGTYENSGVNQTKVRAQDVEILFVPVMQTRAGRRVRSVRERGLV